jgi:uroporphyrinogen decarboxylase
MKNPDRFRDIAEDCRVAKASGLVPVASIQGFFSGIHNSFMDYEETMVNLLLKPDFMRRVTEILARMNLDAVEMLLDRGVEIVTLCDDLGNAGGLLLSPELIRTFFMPWLEELARLVHDRGAYLHLHSHGNIRELLPDFVSIGVDILNPFDWDENPDLPELVRTFGRDVIFCGGVVGDLSRFPVDRVDHIVRRACGLAGQAEKGYILMTGGARDSLTLKEWNAWRDIFARARER